MFLINHLKLIQQEKGYAEKLFDFDIIQYSKLNLFRNFVSVWVVATYEIFLSIR